MTLNDPTIFKLSLTPIPLWQVSEKMVTLDLSAHDDGGNHSECNIREKEQFKQ